MSLLSAVGLPAMLLWSFGAWRRLRSDSKVQRIMIEASPGGFCFVGFRDDSEHLSPVLSNAIKFSQNGGGVTLSASRSDEILTIAVTETGSGIPEEDLIRIVEKFRHRDNLSLQAAGSGLGMPLVKSFVELHGGYIDVESSDGGTKIICCLPMNVTDFWGPPTF